jgi:hypothetical protein
MQVRRLRADFVGPSEWRRDRDPAAAHFPTHDITARPGRACARVSEARVPVIK